MKELLEGNRLWAAERLQQDPGYFKRLQAQQAPEYLWIGCSDSRVPANVITRLDPGEVFVHRNVANLVNPGDLNCLSVLQFAVDVLKVRHILVCGHHGCGGVRAVLSGGRNGIVDYWLRPLREIADLHCEELAPLPMDERVNRLSELSVKKQVERLAATPIVQEAWARGQQLELHGIVYDLGDGVLHDLGCSSSGNPD